MEIGREGGRGRVGKVGKKRVWGRGEVKVGGGSERKATDGWEKCVFMKRIGGEGK